MKWASYRSVDGTECALQDACSLPPIDTEGETMRLLGTFGADDFEDAKAAHLELLFPEPRSARSTGSGEK